MDLDALRARGRSARRGIGARRDELDRRRYELLVESGLLDGATSIAAYLADDGEADPLPWRHVAAGRTVYFPVVPPGGHTISFFAAADRSELQPGRWGILEPTRDVPISLGALDVVLVPLVVFDHRCHRAGRGRGYYDRTLGALDLSSVHDRPVLVGIAHDEQRVDLVPQHRADVPLDAVVTPTVVFRR